MFKRKREAEEKQAKPRHPWRENLEALTMAVIVALVLKAFIIEVSKIPSGSMQPTLMGSPTAGVYDRVIVDKLAYRFRDPERFEIVVFKHPLERSRNMVKRIVGMPSEELLIRHGDLWTRPDADSEWTVLRRPSPVEEETWKLLPPLESGPKAWSEAAGTDGWRFQEDGFEARSSGTARFRELQTIRNDYADGYPAGVRKEAVAEGSANPRQGEEPVGDLRLDGTALVEAGCVEVVIELEEGPNRYRFRIPGPAAPAGSVAGVEIQDQPPVRDPETERIVRPEPRFVEAEAGRLEAGEEYSFRVQNLDDQVRFQLDGEWIAESEVSHVANQNSRISIRVEGTGAVLGDLRVYRDIFYLPAQGESETRFEIPAGHYVVLGDNTLNSADGREWQRAGYVLDADDGESRVIRGNWRPGESPSDPVREGGEKFVFFRDVWGERHQIPGDGRNPNERVRYSQVPRELIHGRALAVFWPLKPFQGVWRLGWIH